MRIGIGYTTEVGKSLQVNVEVGSISTTGIGSTYFQVKQLEISRPGYGFKKGDKFSVVGLVTDGRRGSNGPIEQFVVEVLDTYNDSFSMWRFGDLDYIDSIAANQNGSRKNFTLKYDGEILSFESKDDQDINFANLLLVFVNGILQKPNEAYTFNGGTSIDFTQAPTVNDEVKIFFYRGVDGQDTSPIHFVPKLIEEGDEVQIQKTNNINDLTQKRRTVYDISSSGKIETNLYSDVGITSEFKPLNLIKQKADKQISGVIRHKTRDSIKTQIYPTAKIIGDLSTSDTDIYVDNAEFFRYDVESSETFSVLIVSPNASDPVSAGLSATIGSDGTVSGIQINNGGSGYTGTPTISISAPPSIGIGIGTTATATAVSAGGTVQSITITNAGLGYTIAPKVIANQPSSIKEKVSGINTHASNGVKGFSGVVTGITTTSSGNDLALKFTLHSDSSDFNVVSKSLTKDTPLYIFDTRIGSWLTSMERTGSGVVGIGTSYVDNIYHPIWDIYIHAGVGIITCVIKTGTPVVGLGSTGSINYPVGRFSWGKISGTSVVRDSENPIALGVTGLTINSGLSSFPTVQRRGSGDSANRIGLRDTGSLNWL